MKVLLINGSPHERGCTFTALDEVGRELSRLGVEPVHFWIGSRPVGGCQACGGCARTGNGCVFRGDAVEACMPLATAADGLIVGSPVYYAGPNGQLTSLLDRLFYSCGRHLKLKPGSAVVSCRRGGASATYDRLMKYFEINSMPVVTSQYWNSVHGSTPEQVRLHGAAVARRALELAGDAPVDRELLAELREKLTAIEAKSLTMSQESVAEAIRPKQWYNPFPKVRYTERPDTAAASILEGNIVVLVDNSPSVMILPTTFFDFTQEANEFYFPPLIGSYLRLLRIIVFLISLLITPAWYLMVCEPGRLPGWLDFLSSPEPASLPLLWQLLVVEFLIDVLKLASLNTPDSLSNSFSMLGALILGDFAVQAGWLGPEVLVYMAFVSVAGFAQPSYEMGYAFKLLRVALLLVTAAFDVWGFVLGVLGILLLLATTKPMVGKGYLYPLIPFNGKALRRLLVREPISRDNT